MAGQRPFLKWAGNKFRIITHIQAALPESATRLIEPFAGSGAVFVNTDYPNYLIAEKNPDLINLYQCIQEEGQAFIDYAKRFFHAKNNQAEQYYQLRERFNKSRNPRVRSALFIYLNKHCYNGLCRYNSSGIYNVPFGQRSSAAFPEQALQHFHQQAQRADFVCQDYLHTMDEAKPGDVVYCDPPYVPLSATANFTRYQGDEFTLIDQQALADKAYELADKGVHVIISNHDTPLTRKLYAGAKRHYFEVPRLISRDSATRRAVPELLAVFVAKDQ